MVEEVPARNRVFKVKIRRVAFTPKVDRTIDAALCTHRVGPFNRDQAKNLDLVTGFGELHGGHEPGKSSSYYDDSALRWHSLAQSTR